MSSIATFVPTAKIVDWHALSQVAMVSAIIGIGVTLAMSISVVAMLRAGDSDGQGPAGVAHAWRAVSVLFAAVTVGILLLGIYEIAS
jgi:hypothetical protein